MGWFSPTVKKCKWCGRDFKLNEGRDHAYCGQKCQKEAWDANPRNKKW